MKNLLEGLTVCAIAGYHIVIAINEENETAQYGFSEGEGSLRRAYENMRDCDPVRVDNDAEALGCALDAIADIDPVARKTWEQAANIHELLNDSRVDGATLEENPE